MSYSYITGNSGTTSCPLTAAMIGDLLVGSVFSSSSGACSVSGGGVSVWNAIGTPQNRGDGYYLSGFWGIATSTSGTITVTGQGGSFPGCGFDEFRGNKTSAPIIDGSAQMQGTSNATMSLAVTSTETNELVLGMFAGTSAVTGPGAGWTAGADVYYAFKAAPGTYSPTAMQTSSGTYAAIVASFFSTDSSAGGIPNALMLMGVGS